MKQADIPTLIDRMAEELRQRLDIDEQTVMVGIHTGGVWIARLLHAKLGIQKPLGTLDISFYRDDFTRIGRIAHGDPTGIRRVYAAQPGEDGAERADGARQSCARSLARALRQVRPTHAACVFDGPGPSWRHELDPGYKEGHAPMPEPLREALDDYRRAFREIGVASLGFPGLEADDVIATMAVKAAFGDHARKLAVSSTKSMTGHMLGAAGGAEALFTVLAIRDQVMPPTINLDNAGEQCDLDYVPNTARPFRVDVVLKNSFEMGNQNHHAWDTMV